ncbi:MAG: hypothetical protein JNK66_03485 [Chitinophagales bacterium]|nr:hypothetical protein [Chitinophagales bacterium]
MKRFIATICLLTLVLLFNEYSFAQCAMCKATAETSLDAGSSAAEGLNKGIMYLFMTPYIILGTVGYFWWRSRKKAQAEVE